jgi:hypothetical protein
MKRGSVRRTIALPDDSTGADYAPDGLSETDIDVLLAQAGIDVDQDSMSEPAPVISLPTHAQGTPATQTGGEAA